MSKSQPHSLPTKPSSKSNTENESTICEKLIPDDLSLERTQYLIAKSLRIIKNKKEQNQRYQQNKKLKESDSVVEPCHNSTKRSTRSEKESIPLFDPVTAIGTEIHCILDYDSVDRMIEAKKSFRWVSHYNKPLFVLQYRTQDRLYFDWLHVKKSTIPRSGLGLFAVCDMYKNTVFSIYLGRVVKKDDPERNYLIQMKKSFVKPKIGDPEWRSVRKGRKNTIIDALMEDNVEKWKYPLELHLAGHMMNDPSFGKKKSPFEANAMFNPMLEVTTTRDVLAGEELFVNYNC